MGKKSRKPKQGEKQNRSGVASSVPTAASSGNSAAACWICLDGDPDCEGKPIVRDCSCRGDDAGFAHYHVWLNTPKQKVGKY